MKRNSEKKNNSYKITENRKKIFIFAIYNSIIDILLDMDIQYTTNFFSELESISKSIKYVRFPLTIFIVMYHCFCVLTPQDQPIYGAVTYPFGLIWGETGVPAFFFISGFLFFISQRTFNQKIKSRVSTLLIPYVIWNSIILLSYVILMLVGHSLEIAGKSISEYQLTDYLRAYIDRGEWDKGNGQPMLCPYWYIRNLIVLSLIAPLIQYIIKGVKGVFILLALLIWWISLPYNGMIAQSLLFFCLGAFFSVNKISPLVPHARIIKRTIYILWGVFFSLDWLIHTCLPIQGGLYIHRIVLITNIFILLQICSKISMLAKSPPILEKSSFWIYTTHFPLIVLLRSTHLILNDWEQFFLYWTSVFLITLFCMTTYVIGIRLTPSVMNILTGNR